MDETIIFLKNSTLLFSQLSKLVKKVSILAVIEPILLATHSSYDLSVLPTGLQVLKSNSFLNQSSKETIKDRME